MNPKKLAAIGAILVMALALLGVGYGLWFEDLLLKGAVTTGELDVEFSEPYVFQWFSIFNGRRWVGMVGEHTPLFRLKTQGGELVNCYAELGQTDEAKANPVNQYDDGPNLLRIGVRGAYPSYHCAVIFDVTNIGTVPVHLTPPSASERYPMVSEVSWCFDKGMIPPVWPEGFEGYGDEDWEDIETWASGEGCVPNPDDLVSGGITRVDGTFQVEIKNTSATCTYHIGMASYEKFASPDEFGSQWLYDYQEVEIAPETTELLVVDDPGCRAQVDTFYGPTLWVLREGQYPDYWYGGRKIDFLHFDDAPWCDPKWQLHPGEHTYCGLVIHFTNHTRVDGRLVQEDANYEFEYVIHAYQWNEDDAAAAMWNLP